jgi:homocysteine S-methyltransferase
MLTCDDVLLMISVRERIAQRQLVLTEGAVIERLRRSAHVVVDPEVANTALVYDAAGREALRRIWRSYLDVARDSKLPMIVCAPTWRATPERLKRAGLPPASQVCAEAVDLVRELRLEYAADTERIYVAGLMGCRGDAYRPDDALTAPAAQAFHAEQAHALAEARVDLIVAATLPCAREALGLARAIAATGVPYIVGFVVRADGSLLDGEPLGDAVARLDDGLGQPPLGYAGTCVHPDIFDAALETLGSHERFVALQGNASRLSPEELDGRAEIDTDSPESFAKSAAAVVERFGLSIVGGCCGTDERHIRALAETIVRCS